MIILSITGDLVVLEHTRIPPLREWWYSQCIKTGIINKVKSELLIRISKGYENINLDLAGELVNKALTDTNIV